MPKSGSHLLTQVLGGLTDLGPFVNPGFPPVNRDEFNCPLEIAQIAENLRNMKSGDIRYGYIHAKEPFLSLLCQPEFAVIFLYRDPRDMLISHIFYAKDMYPGHGMHYYYNNELQTMEERINAAIRGVSDPGYELSSVRQRYDSYLGWLAQPQVLGLKFEDLIFNRDESLLQILDFLQTRGSSLGVSRKDAVKRMNLAVRPTKSGTFRRGIPGEWRMHFSEQNKVVFKQVAGNLLQQLGYEDSSDW